MPNHHGGRVGWMVATIFESSEYFFNFDGIVTDLEDSLRSEVDIEDISTRGVELLVERERPRTGLGGGGGDGIGAGGESTTS